MKISRINLLTANYISQPKFQHLKSNNYAYTSKPSFDTFIKEYTTTQNDNKNTISFKGSDYEQTLEDNYFQLPKGAKPDSFQKASAQNIYLDNDVLVTAPTGTGKTAIAHYAITKNLKNGEKTFYTTPLKALSNEKFRDFQKIYGEDNVGILTGDTKINKDAPIVIMTTEVYRNMVFGEKFGKHNDMLDNLKTVIFDELHYLGDVDRGGIWEQSIFLSDPDTQLLSLSATIGNNKDIAGWMAKTREQEAPEVVAGTNKDLRNYRANADLPIHTVLVDVPSENRHVPLEFENITVLDKNSPEKTKKKSKFNERIDRLTKLAEKKGIIPAYTYADVVQRLKDEDKLPAIFFVFDKKNSADILDYLSRYGIKLTTPEEREEIQNTLDEYEASGKYLGESLNTKALLKGYAIHNAGMLPTQKELVEELFQRKLVKAVIATETLSAGINMPTRTTLITATRKPSSTPDGPDSKRYISPNEFHQMAGRAGRRGIDKKGYCYTLSLDEEQAQIFDQLVHSKPNSLKSAFKPDYSFIAKYYDACQNDEMLNLICDKSFYTYNKNDRVAQRNKQNLKRMFDKKINIMKEFGYLKSGNTLSKKGILIANLNGYEQIPIMEMVTSKAFKDMTPVELAASVGALANLDYQKDFKFKTQEVNGAKPFNHDDEKLNKFISKLNSTLAKYNDLTKDDTKAPRNIEANYDLTKNIYSWAELNNENEDSVNNWSRLYYNADKRHYKDEGSFFKGIMMTIDLLKQLKLVCDVGINISRSQDEYDYYSNLRANIDEAIDLINKEPAIG